RAILVGPLHEHREVAGDLGRLEFKLAEEHLASAAVQRNPVAFLDDMLADGELTSLVVDLDGSSARHAALAHPSSHDGRVGGLAATSGEDSLRGVHPANVLRRGLQTDE